MHKTDKTEGEGVEEDMATRAAAAAAGPRALAQAEMATLSEEAEAGLSSDEEEDLLFYERCSDSPGSSHMTSYYRRWLSPVMEESGEDVDHSADTESPCLVQRRGRPATRSLSDLDLLKAAAAKLQVLANKSDLSEEDMEDKSEQKEQLDVVNKRLLSSWETLQDLDQPYDSHCETDRRRDTDEEREQDDEEEEEMFGGARMETRTVCGWFLGKWNEVRAGPGPGVLEEGDGGGVEIDGQESDENGKKRPLRKKKKDCEGRRKGRGTTDDGLPLVVEGESETEKVKKWLEQGMDGCSQKPFTAQGQVNGAELVMVAIDTKPAEQAGGKDRRKRKRPRDSESGGEQEKHLRDVQSETTRMQKWLQEAQASLGPAEPQDEGRPSDFTSQLVDCQLLKEIERKVSVLSQLLLQRDCLRAAQLTQAPSMVPHTFDQMMQVGRLSESNQGSSMFTEQINPETAGGNGEASEKVVLKCREDEVVEEDLALKSTVVPHRQDPSNQVRVTAREAEGDAHSEEMYCRLGVLKNGLLELQKVLLDRQNNLQAKLKQEEADPPEDYSEEVVEVAQSYPRICCGGIGNMHSNVANAFGSDECLGLLGLKNRIVEQKNLITGVMDNFYASISNYPVSERSFGEKQQIQGQSCITTLEPHFQLLCLKEEQKSKLDVLQALMEQPFDNMLACGSQPVLCEATQPGLCEEAEDVILTLKSVYPGDDNELEGERFGDAWLLAVRATGCWVDGIQEFIFKQLLGSSGEVQSKLENVQRISKYLEEVSQDLESCTHSVFSASIYEHPDSGVLEQVVIGLQKRLHVMKSCLQRACDVFQSHLAGSAEFQEMLHETMNTMIKKRKALLLSPETYTQQAGSTTGSTAFDEAMEALEKYEQNIATLRKQASNLQLVVPFVEWDIMRLEHVAEALHWEIAHQRREQQARIAAINHFQRVLQQLEATTAAGRDGMAERHRALCEGQQIVEMLQTHQELFYRLKYQELLLKKLALGTAHSEELTPGLEDLQQRAQRRAAWLWQLGQAWEKLESELDSLHNTLKSIEQSVPPGGLLEDSEEQVAQCINLYEHLKNSLDEHQAKLCRALAYGKKLRHLTSKIVHEEADHKSVNASRWKKNLGCSKNGEDVILQSNVNRDDQEKKESHKEDILSELNTENNLEKLERVALGLTSANSNDWDGAPSEAMALSGNSVPIRLEKQLVQLGERWLNCGSTVGRELSRLEALITHLIRFHRDSAELGEWLTDSLARLEHWRRESDSVEQDFTIARSHLNSFVDFMREVDEKSTFKSSVVSTGGQLMKLKVSDSASLRTQLGQVEMRWSELVSQLPSVQEKLHQLQMDKLKSHEASNELLGWIESTEAELRAEEKEMETAMGLEQIKVYLNKYKGKQLLTQRWQLTLDAVKQALGHQCGHDAANQRQEQIAFAEMLGMLNHRWHCLQGLLASKVQFLEGQSETWDELEAQACHLDDWLQAQAQQVEQLPVLSEPRMAFDALRECLDLEEKLKQKQDEIEKVESATQALLPASNQLLCALGETLIKIQKSAVDLQEKIMQAKNSFKSLCSYLEEHGRVRDAVNEHLIEGKCTMLSIDSLKGCAYAVHYRVEILQHLQSEEEMSKDCIQKLVTVTEALQKHCLPNTIRNLNEDVSDVRQRVVCMYHDLAVDLREAKAALQLLAKHESGLQKIRDTLSHLESAVSQLAQDTEGLLLEELESQVATCEEWLTDASRLLKSLESLTELEQELAQVFDAHSLSTLSQERNNVKQRLVYLQHLLKLQCSVLQNSKSKHEMFTKYIKEMERILEEVKLVVEQQRIEVPNARDSEVVQKYLSELEAELQMLMRAIPKWQLLRALGLRLCLDGRRFEHSQMLDRRWKMLLAEACKAYRNLQGLVLGKLELLEKCHKWQSFLEALEQIFSLHTENNSDNSLKKNTSLIKESFAVNETFGNDCFFEIIPNCNALAFPPSYRHILKQKRFIEVLQMEMFCHQNKIESILLEAQELQELDVDRKNLCSKLFLMYTQWCDTAARVQLISVSLDIRLAKWQQFLKMHSRLQELLQHHKVTTGSFKASMDGCNAENALSVQEVTAMLDDAQHTEKALKADEECILLMLAVGQELIQAADTTSCELLSKWLLEDRRQWKEEIMGLESLKLQITHTVKEWESCERVMTESLDKLGAFQERLAEALPETFEDLQAEHLHCKVLEIAIEEAAVDLVPLALLQQGLRSSLAGYDLARLDYEVSGLQWQWKQLHYRVCTRGRRVQNRLREWDAFAECDKVLCDWLTSLERRVAQNGECGLETMLLRLEKECRDEIVAASGARGRLHGFGERLILLSGQDKAKELQDRLAHTDEYWRHLFDLWTLRVRRSKEMAGSMQALDYSMSSLRSWLAHVEAELSRPIIFDSFDSQEIQLKLNEHQELQRDIEEHNAGVASVLSVCGVLLRDCDSCASEAECDAVQQATRSLERRWRNICSMAMERRLRIEDTWRLWQKFQGDYTRFEDWLSTSERTAASPNSSLVLFSEAKEELKKFEAFQRQVHESLTQLELINKQYRRLARENRTDSACRLRDMVHRGNQRWEELQRRVAAVQRRLRYFVSQREEFECTRESLVVWLTQMDLQLTTLEHFSEFDHDVKLRQLRAYQQEIELNTVRIEELITHAEELIMKSEPLDAAAIEEELEQLRRDWQDVFARVERYLTRIHGLPVIVTGDEREVSDVEAETEELEVIGRIEPYRPIDVSTTATTAASCFLQPLSTRPQGQSALRSGRDTPASLEWDYQYDITRPEASGDGGGNEDEDEHDNDRTFTLDDSGLSGNGGRVLDHQLQQLDGALDACRFHLQQTEIFLSRRTPTGPDLDSAYDQYMQLLAECQDSIERVRTVGQALQNEETLGSIHPPGLERKISGVFERWELLREQAELKQQRMLERLRRHEQFGNQLREADAWLDQMTARLKAAREQPPANDLPSLKQQQVLFEEFQEEIEMWRPLLLSLQLSSHELEWDGIEVDSNLPTGDEHEAIYEGLTDSHKDVTCQWEGVLQSLADWRHSLDSHQLIKAIDKDSHPRQIEHASSEIRTLGETDAMQHSNQPDFSVACRKAHALLTSAEEKRSKLKSLRMSSDTDLLLAHQENLKDCHRELQCSATQLSTFERHAAEQRHNPWGTTEPAQCQLLRQQLAEMAALVERDLKKTKRIAVSSQRSHSATTPEQDEDLRVSDCPPQVCSPPSSSRKVAAVSSGAERGRWFIRVLRFALPFQLLLLFLLFLAACLAPGSEERLSCTHANTFARSFHPMLTYTNGPPPT
uniref:nesprin-1-like isoform X2 n=1 Tax=Myxine glutinosa TaxID=7769 RepID=UPI00358F25D2